MWLEHVGWYNGTVPTTLAGQNINLGAGGEVCWNLENNAPLPPV